MKMVYTNQNLMNCYIAKNTLEIAGILTFIKNESTCHTAAGGLGSALVFAWPEVWIKNDSDQKRAEECLEKAALSLDDSNEENTNLSNSRDAVWTCSTCNEDVPASFEICWNCGQEAPEGKEDKINY